MRGGRCGAGCTRTFDCTIGLVAGFGVSERAGGAVARDLRSVTFDGSAAFTSATSANRAGLVRAAGRFGGCAVGGHSGHLRLNCCRLTAGRLAVGTGLGALLGWRGRTRVVSGCRLADAPRIGVCCRGCRGVSRPLCIGASHR